MPPKKPLLPPEAADTNGQATDDAPKNLGALEDNPTVKREPVTTKLPDGTVRKDY